MRVCAVVKYPPIQGGVSARSFWISRALAARGHDVTVVTNAEEVEADYRIWMPPEDSARGNEPASGRGSVRVVSSGCVERLPRYIPRANPFATKLAALATEEIRSLDAEIVFSSYFEPYGLSGHLAASWTGLPHVVQHAGSDRTRLMDHPDLATAYREMLRHASLVVTGGSDLRGLGVPRERLIRPQISFLPEEFNPDGPVLDVAALMAGMRRDCPDAVADAGPLDRDTAIIGIYGKLGDVKGSYDLLAALERLRDQGHRFQLVAMVGGPERPRFRAAVERAGLTERVWMLPFLPHWRVPEFLRMCTAVCFLERNFPVEIHAPGVPREILSCGTCAVLSAEVARKQSFWSDMRNGENAVVVEDPRDIDALAAALAAVVADPSWAQAIGAAGLQLVRTCEPTTGSLDDLGRVYESLFDRAVAVRRSRPSRGPDERANTSRAFNEVVGLVERHMPATSRMAGDRLTSWLASSLKPGPDDDVPDDWAEGPTLDVVGLGERLAALVMREAADLGQPAIVAEVVRYESHLLWLAVDTESARGLPHFARRALDLGVNYDRCPDQFRPEASNWVCVRHFDYDVEGATGQILQAGRLQEAQVLNGGQTLVFQKRGSLRGRVFQVNEPTAELLARCDGTRTVSDVIQTIARDFGATSSSAHQMLLKLGREGLISLPGALHSWTP